MNYTLLQLIDLLIQLTAVLLLVTLTLITISQLNQTLLKNKSLKCLFQYVELYVYVLLFLFKFQMDEA